MLCCQNAYFCVRTSTCSYTHVHTHTHTHTSLTVHWPTLQSSTASPGSHSNINGLATELKRRESKKLNIIEDLSAKTALSR